MEENEKKNFYGKKTAKLSFGYKRFTILVRSSSYRGVARGGPGGPGRPDPPQNLANQ